MLHKLANGSIVRVIGDPHFGRRFINGVPLNRRGEREADQHALFTQLMNNMSYINDTGGIEAKTVVMMGDLFDQFKVDNDTLLMVYEAIAIASWNYEDVQFFMIQGNHDVTRDKESVSSFEVLARMLEHRENVHFVTEPEYHITPEGDGILLFPYDAFTKASDLARTEKFFKRDNITAAFGHWDVEDFGNDHNLIPLKELAPICRNIFTGHVHAAREWWVDKEGNPLKDGPITDLSQVCTVTITGSMVPLSHGEDPTGKIYVTVDLETFQDAVAKHPDWYHNKAVRILLKPGQELPADIDALQISYKFVDQDEKEETEVKMEVFSFKTLFDECLRENDVSEDDIAIVWENYQEKSRDAQEA